MSEGTTLYCGDVCNHTGPHRLRPEPQFVSTRCPHGLDMRIYPRCYLCVPLVAGCQCPSFWWGLTPPPCPVHNPPSPYTTTTTTWGNT